MPENPFISKDHEPNDENLKKALSLTYGFYNELMEATREYSTKWSFYKNGGWILKVFDKKKALFYVVPNANEFQVSMTIREKEREAFLKDKELKFLANELKDAKKYPEGYGMQLIVSDKKSFSECMLFIGKLINSRQ